MTLAGVSLITWVPIIGDVRGGAWNNNQNNARVAARNRNNPSNSNNNIGFRVVSHDLGALAGNAGRGYRRRPRLATCLECERCAERRTLPEQAGTKDGVIGSRPDRVSGSGRKYKGLVA